MKKFIKPWMFYISFFAINMFNAYMFTSGLAHPNISEFSRSFSNIITSVVGDIGIIALLFSISWLIFRKTKSRIRFLSVITIILTVFCLGLSSFANIFSLGFSFFQLDSFQNPTQMDFILYYAQYALSFIINVPQNFYFFTLLIFIFIRVFTDTSHHEHCAIYKKLTALVISIIAIIIPNVTFQKNKQDSIFAHTQNPIKASTEVGLYNYYLGDLFNYLTYKEKPMTTAEKELIENYLELKSQSVYINPLDQQEYTRNNEFTNKADGMNLVFMQVEALNNFVVDLVVNGIEITPNLNKFIKESLYYDNFYASAGIGNTSDSEFSALTGLHGNGNELTMIASSGNNYETLAKDFKQKNYTTFSLHGNVGEFYKRNERHLDVLGFDKHYEKKDYIEHMQGELMHTWINDIDFLRHSVRIFAEQTEPFFAFPITVSSHAPYVPSTEVPCNEHYFGKITKLSHNYLEHIIYFDRAFGIFIDEMEKANLLDNTVIVLFGDHTSSLFKYDLESIYQRKITDLEYRQEMQKVPLVIYGPKLFEPAINNSVYSTVDLYPTFANLFGLEYKYKFSADILSGEPTLSYSPRTLDIFYNDFTIIYPTKKAIGLDDEELKKDLINNFIHYKKMNDLILKTKYFR